MLSKKDLLEFFTPKAPENVIKVITGNPDPEVTAKLIAARFREFIPDGWPPIILLKNRTEGMKHVLPADMATSVLIGAILTSDHKEGIEHMPTSFWKVRDGIWEPKPGFFLVWDHRVKAFRGDLASPAAVERLQKALANVAPGITPHNGEAIMAGLLLGLSRTMQRELLPAQLQKVTDGMYERGGFSGAELTASNEAARRTAFNHLLSRSPMFDVARVVVCAEYVQGDTRRSEILYFKVLYNVEEAETKDLAKERVWDLLHNTPEHPNVTSPPDTGVFFDEGDSGFEVFHHAPAWSHIQTSEWVPSPATQARLEEWEDIIVGTLGGES